MRGKKGEMLSQKLRKNNPILAIKNGLTPSSLYKKKIRHTIYLYKLLFVDCQPFDTLG